MVSSQEIRASNARVDDTNTPQVAVFVGGTAGIGKLTISALVATGVSVSIYLIGRKSFLPQLDAFEKELYASNPRAEIVWIEGEVSLLADVKRICTEIKAKESYIDLLFLTAGHAPIGPRQLTAEGLEVSQSLEYYSRMLFTIQLLPTLKQSSHPRVISVLGGGLERVSALSIDDLDLEQPGNFFRFATAQGHYLTMGTVGLDKLAAEHKDVTFIHSWPGPVDTGNVRRGNPGFLLSWLIWGIINPVLYLLSISDDEAGQRHLFQATSAAFGGYGTPWSGRAGIATQEGPRGGGFFLVNTKCDCTPNDKVVSELRRQCQAKVWEHTQKRLAPYLS